MNHRLALLAAALAMAAAGPPAQASSTTASSASDSSTASVGSVSGSLGTSSNSSSKTVTAADGDYKIIEVAAAPQQPGMVQLKLQATADRGADSEFTLYLPQAIAERTRLSQGAIVTTRSRPYGTEFAVGTAPFFLVVTDDWYRELQTHAVQL